MSKFKSSISLIKSLGIIQFVKIAIRRIFQPKRYKLIPGHQELECYYVNKCGLEIGGPSAIFMSSGAIPIYNKMKSLDGVNYAENTVWTGEIDEKDGFTVNGKRVGRLFILEAVDLFAIRPHQYDFVLSSNNIEHIANPLKAIQEWISVLKNGGALIVVAPKKESNFDHRRKVVSFDHLVEDFQQGMKEDDLTHLPEILTLHDLRMDPLAGTFEQFRERSTRNFENRCLHHHVFDLQVLSMMFQYFDVHVLKTIELDTDYIIVGIK